MVKKGNYIAILAGLLFISLLAYALISYGFGQKFFIVLIIVIVGIVSWDDGFSARRKNQKALIDHLLLPTFILIILPPIYTLSILGLQDFLKISGIILVGIICWAAGLRYGKMQHKGKNICLLHLPFSLILGCTLLHILSVYNFSQVFLFIALIITLFNLSIVYFSQRQNPHPSLGHHPEDPLIYSQPNWTEELQRVLAVEMQEIKGQLSIWHHKDLLRQRYRRLTETAIQDGRKPEQLVEWVEDQLKVVQPSHNPVKIADSILNSEAFHNVLMNRDEPMETEIADQKMLRRLYDGTNLGQIVWLLRELFQSSRQHKEMLRDLYRRLAEKSLSMGHHREDPLIYSQPNWPDEFQQVLAVEVPEIKGRLPLGHHKDLLGLRYRKLAEEALERGQKPENLVADFLEMIPPADDPKEIVEAILNSEAFYYVMGSRDETREMTWITDQKNLRQMYDGIDLEQIVRLLRELYLNGLDVEG